MYDRAPALSLGDLEGYATQVGLDAAKFKTCLESGQDKAKVEHNLQDALDRHLPGTPAFLVNNQAVIGPQSFEYFKNLSSILIWLMVNSRWFIFSSFPQRLSAISYEP